MGLQAVKLLARLVLALALCCTPAQAWWQSVAQVSVGTAGYTGPGDIVSGATIFWGVVAYNAAYATGSNPAFDVCDVATGLTCSTINILTTGYADFATAAASVACATACGISKFYNQVTNGTLDIVQSDRTRRPTLTFSSLGSCAGALFNGSTVRLVSSGNWSQSQPFSGLVVFKRTSVAAAGALGVSTPDAVELGANLADRSFIAATSTANGTAGDTPDNSFNVVQGIYNSSSSIIVANSTTTSSLNPGTGNPNGTVVMGAGDSSGNDRFPGTIMFGGWWPAAFSGTQSGNLNTNARSFCGGF